jgi:hypothetical protein
MTAKKNSNLYVYRDDLDELKRIAEEYVFLGKSIKLEGNKLTVFATPPKKPTKKKDRNDRDKGRSPRPTRD